MKFFHIIGFSNDFMLFDRTIAFIRAKGRVALVWLVLSRSISHPNSLLSFIFYFALLSIHPFVDALKSIYFQIEKCFGQQIYFIDVCEITLLFLFLFGIIFHFILFHSSQNCCCKLIAAPTLNVTFKILKFLRLLAIACY